MKKSILWVGALVIVVLLYFDRCTTANITTAFNTSYKSYRWLKDGISGRSHSIRRISRHTYNDISYNPTHNLFLINNSYGVTRFDGNGKKLDTVDTGDKELIRYTFYLVDSMGIYDLSKDHIVKEPFKEVINRQQTMDDSLWQQQFNTFYKQAQVVVYGSNKEFYRNSFPIYFRIKNEWTVMIPTRAEDRFTDDNLSEITFKDFPARYDALYLLKDMRDHVYSNMTNITDDYLATYTVHIKESHLVYPVGPFIKTEGYRKEGVAEKAAYLGAPVAWLVSAGFSIRVDNETLYFKANSQQDIGLGRPVDQYFLWYRTPEKFKNKAQVSFIKFAYPSNQDETESAGLYIVRKQ